jgi:hypothetical protein
MKKSYARLSLVVFLGALALGLSSVAKAELYVQWVSAHKKLDCPATCGETGLKYTVPTGINRKGKPSFHICLAFGDDKLGHGSRVGFNLNGEASCTTVVDNKIYQSKGYYCQCSNNPRPHIPRG